MESTYASKKLGNREFYDNVNLDDIKLTAPFHKYLLVEMRLLYTSQNPNYSYVCSDSLIRNWNYKSDLMFAKVLDIGCGTGRSTLMLSDLSREVAGIDRSEKSLEKAKVKLLDRSNVTLYNQDASNMNFEDNSFDKVFMLWNTFGNLYEHREAVLEEAIRVVKPKGEICLSVLSDKSLEKYIDMLKLNNLTIAGMKNDYIYLKEGLISERFSMRKMSVIMDRYSKTFPITAWCTPLTDISLWCRIFKK